MYYISLLLVLAGVFITPSIYTQNPEKPNHRLRGFTAPLDIPMVLSGNYGEIRATHFHAGIDIKTEQVEGKHVLAADSGTVFRISVQSGGYGNAVYMKHPGGQVSVYGHLSRFEPELEKYVKEQQYKKKSFTVDLYPEAGRFNFPRGGFLGFSGNSGSSGGPHLHFEIRDQTGSVPLNALNYGLAIQDKTSPEIRWLALYPVDTNSTVNGVNQKMLVQVNGKKGNHFISAGTVNVSGKIGLGIETYDFLDNAPNECGPYTLSLTIDGNQVFLCRFDSISFSSAGYVNSHIDYEERIRSGKKIQKLFLDPNNQLKIYKVAKNKGIIQFQDTVVHRVNITVKDAYGNESVLKFGLRYSRNLNKPENPGPDPDVAARFYYDSLNIYESNNIRIAVPRGALFDHINFSYAQESNDSFKYSAIHQVHNIFTPLFKSYILSIKPHYLPERLQSRALIAYRTADGAWKSQGGDYKNGFVTARVQKFGRFIVTVDTIAPVVSPFVFKAGERYSKGQVISFHISDSLSGIRRYSGMIDKKWALFAYDAKNDLLSYTVDEDRLEKNKEHDLLIYLTDNKDNETQFRARFFY